MLWRTLFATIVFLGAGLAFGQSRPPVCEAEMTCARSVLAPKPETGIWFDVDRPGSGFMLEVQNESVGGYYFGYDQAGNPEWYLIAGELEPGESKGTDWRLEANLLRFSGGSCLGCPYQEPDSQEPQGTITIEFKSRNEARFLLNQQHIGRFQTLTYGVGGKELFPETSLVFPDIQGMWTLVKHDRSKELEGDRKRAIDAREVKIEIPHTEEGHAQTLFFIFNEFEALAVGRLECETQSNGAGGVCRVTLVDESGESNTYFMPLGNLGDAYFFAKAVNGDTLEGYRNGYD